MKEKPQTPNPEKLQHIPGEIVIGLTQSPKGKVCIGMTFEDREWALLTVKGAPLADQTRRVLKDQFGIETIPGMPFNWRESIANRKLTVEERSGAIGVYVPVDNFDDLVETLSGL